MQRTKFRGYKLFHDNWDAAESMIRQIDEFPSFFMPDGERPLIIDCGANIGVSVLEWKTRWPQSQVVCFEPDPYAFAILQRNIQENDIPGVDCHRAAVSDREGTTALYGNIAPASDARGNSIDPAWGVRAGSVQCDVTSVRLSNYVRGRDVSFLKLDIEGAEQRVLKEVQDHLDRVQAVYVEVHETDESHAYNSADQIESLLSESGFTVESESRYDPHALPAHLDQWRRSVGARQTQLLGWR